MFVLLATLPLLNVNTVLANSAQTGAPAGSPAAAAPAAKSPAKATSKKKAKSKAKSKSRSKSKAKAKSKSTSKPVVKSSSKASSKPKSESKAKVKSKAKTYKKQGKLKKPSGKRSRKLRRRGGGIDPVSTGMKMGLRGTPDELAFKSSAALVVDQDTGETVAFKNPDVVLPIASLTKLMTALVVLESGQPLDEMLEISREDVDTQKYTHSRLSVGTRLSRDRLLLLALMSSENRAAMALGRNYPGGRAAFVEQMNHKANALGMKSTHFSEPAGLSNQSVSSARDLHRLLSAAYDKPLIRAYSTQTEDNVRVGRRNLTFVNSNRLVRSSGSDWDIGLQKTGFTNEAGRCLVMQATVLGRRLVMIFLDSTGTLTRYADAARVRRLLEKEPHTVVPAAVSTSTPTS